MASGLMRSGQVGKYHGRRYGASDPLRRWRDRMTSRPEHAGAKRPRPASREQSWASDRERRPTGGAPRQYAWRPSRCLAVYRVLLGIPWRRMMIFEEEVAYASTRKVPHRLVMPDPKYNSRNVTRMVEPHYVGWQAQPRRAHHLRRARSDRAARASATRSMSSSRRCEQRHAVHRGQATPCRRLNLSGAGRDSQRAQDGAGDALADRVIAQPRPAVARWRRSWPRVDGCGGRAGRDDSQDVRKPIRWRSPTRPSPITAGRRHGGLRSYGDERISPRKNAQYRYHRAYRRREDDDN